MNRLEPATGMIRSDAKRPGQEFGGWMKSVDGPELIGGAG